MATATLEKLDSLAADPILLEATINGVESCLTMCDTKAKCVGISTIPTREAGRVTGMIGVHGEVSGFITVNMAEQVAMSAVGGLLQEPCTTLTPQVIDGVGEMTNLISGVIKKGVAGSKWGFSHVTVPSVIVGHNYQIAYAKGLQYLSAVFEQQGVQTVMLDERLLQVAVSLIRV